jgi:hypothetical protein
MDIWLSFRSVVKPFVHAIKLLLVHASSILIDHNFQFVKHLMLSWIAAVLIHDHTIHNKNLLLVDDWKCRFARSLSHFWIRALGQHDNEHHKCNSGHWAITLKIKSWRLALASVTWDNSFWYSQVAPGSCVSDYSVSQTDSWTRSLWTIQSRSFRWWEQWN